MFRVSAVVSCLAVAPLASADVLFSQPNDRPAEPSFFSDAVSGQFFSQRIADNFSLSADSTIDSLRWWGGSQNFAFADLTNMESWTVEIFSADAAGGVGDLAFSATYFIGSARGGSLEMTVNPTGDLNLTGGQVFEHEAQTGGLSLDAGDYWFSVGATLVQPFGDGWVWAGSTVGDLVNATDFFDGSGFVVFDPTFNDLAFEIEGTAIPAPASALVLGLALAGVTRRR